MAAMLLEQLMDLMNSRDQGNLNTLTVPIPASHQECMVCGQYDSLELRFRAYENGVEAVIQASPKWQGYRGFLHGGMISTLLDAAMTHCLFDHGVEAVTADLKIRFLQPTPCSKLLTLRARLLSKRHHLYHLSADLSCATGLLAQASARFMKRKSS